MFLGVFELFGVFLHWILGVSVFGCFYAFRLCYWGWVVWGFLVDLGLVCFCVGFRLDLNVLGF